jgi:hypothetical protein
MFAQGPLPPENLFDLCVGSTGFLVGLVVFLVINIMQKMIRKRGYVFRRDLE